MKMTWKKFKKELNNTVLFTVLNKQVIKNKKHKPWRVTTALMLGVSLLFNALFIWILSDTSSVDYQAQAWQNGMERDAHFFALQEIDRDLYDNQTAYYDAVYYGAMAAQAMAFGDQKNVEKYYNLSVDSYHEADDLYQKILEILERRGVRKPENLKDQKDI